MDRVGKMRSLLGILFTVVIISALNIIMLICVFVVMF